MEESEYFFISALFSLLLIYVIGKILSNKSQQSLHHSTNDIITEYENYIRLLTCINYAGTEALRDIMFDINYGLPKNKRKLFQKLLLSQPIFKKMNLRQYEWDLLYPASQETNYMEFDISLMYKIIRTCTSLQPPVGGWKIRKTQANDRSTAAFVILLKDFRNDLSHINAKQITNVDFENKWNKLINTLQGLKFDITKIVNLKTCVLGTTIIYQQAFFKSQLEVCYEKVQDLEETQDLRITELNKKLSIDKSNIDQMHSSFMKETTILSSHIQEHEKDIMKTQTDLHYLRKCIDDVRLKNNGNLSMIFKRIRNIEIKLPDVLHANPIEIEQDFDVSNMLKQNKEERPVNGGDLTFLGSTSDKYWCELKLERQHITNEKLEHLNKSICCTPYIILDVLDLSNCNINDTQLKELGGTIPRLKEIRLSKNKSITFQAWKYISDVMMTIDNPRLQLIKLSDCNLGDEELMALVDMILAVKDVDLNSNPGISHIGLKSLSESFQYKSKCQLINLNLDYCQLHDAHIAALASLIPSLQRLTLYYNASITENGLNMIEQFVKSSKICNLSYIDLRGLNISNGMLTSIARLSCHVSDITFRHNPNCLTATDYQAYANVIIANNPKTINFNGFSVPDKCLNALIPCFPYLRLMVFVESGTEFDFEEMFCVLLNADFCRLEAVMFRRRNFTISQLESLADLLELGILKRIYMIRCCLSTCPVVKNTSINYFYLADCEFTEECAKAIAKTANSTESMYVKGSKECIQKLAKYITKEALSHSQSCLESFQYHTSKLGPEGLLEYLPFIKNLKDLDLSGNHSISPLCLKQFADAIYNNNKLVLQKINFSDCGLDDIKLQALSHLFRKVGNVVISKNSNISYKGWKVISETISNSHTSMDVILNAEDCCLNDHCLKEISCMAPYIQKMTLSSNKSITAAGMQSLTSAILQSPSNFLEDLFLCDGNIVDLHLAALSKAIPLFSSLHLDNNGTLKILSMTYISAAIQGCVTLNLTTLSLQSCNLTDLHLKRFTAIGLIQNVNLSKNSLITPIGWKSLSFNICDFSPLLLKNLTLQDCSIAAEDMRSLCESFCLLLMVDLSTNPTITGEAIQYLNEAVINASSLVLDSVNLSNCNLCNDQVLILIELLKYVKTVNISSNDRITLNYLTKNFQDFGYCKPSFTRRLNCGSHLMDGEAITSVHKVANLVDWNDIVPPLSTLPVLKNHLSASRRTDNSLMLRYSNVLDKHVEVICAIIPSLHKIDLSGNIGITADGYNSITGSCESSSTFWLHEVHFVNCNINDEKLGILSSILINIKTVVLDKNKTITQNGIEEMVKVILSAEMLVLESVSFAECDFTDSHIRSLTELIPHVKKIVLRGNKKITALGWRNLEQFKSKPVDWVRLKHLDLTSCRVNKTHMKYIRYILPYIETLIVGNDREVDESTIKCLSECVTSTDIRTINSIKLTNPNPSELQLQSFAQVVPVLKDLDFDMIRNMPLKAFCYIHNACINARSVMTESMTVQNTRIRDHHMLFLGKVSLNLKSVNLSENKLITEDGFQLYFKQFSNLKSDKGVKLKRLILKNCHLTDKKLRYLAEILSMIESVDLSTNKSITASAISHISSTISSSASFRLQSLDLSNCNISYGHLIKMADIIPLLHELILGSNKTLTGEDLNYLAKIIRNSNPKRIDVLNLSNCNLNDDKLKEFTCAIPFLNKLDISSNQWISHESLQQLAKTVLENADTSRLEVLSINDCYIREKDVMVLLPILKYLKTLELQKNESLKADVVITLASYCNTEDFAFLDKILITPVRISDAQFDSWSTLLLKSKDLQLSKSMMLSSDKLKSIRHVLKNDCNFESITIKDFKPKPFMLEEISDVLFKIKKITFNNSFFTTNGFKGFTDSTVTSKECLTEHVKLTNCKLQEFEHMSSLFTRIATVDFSNNTPFPAQLLEHFAKDLEQTESYTLKSLILTDTNLNDNHMVFLKKIVQRLTELNISKNKHITVDGWKYLCQGISGSDNLINLMAQDCNLSDVHLLELSKAVRYMKKLDIGYNKSLSSTCLKHLCKKLNDTKTFEILVLKSCNLTETHFEVVKDFFGCLSELDLSENIIMDSKYLKIFNCLKTPGLERRIKAIHLSQCNIKEAHLMSIVKALPCIKELNLSQNCLLTPDSYKAFAKMMLKSYPIIQLEKLDLSENNLMDKHMEWIVKMIPIINEVNIGGNKLITFEGYHRLKEELCAVDTVCLQKLDISNNNLTDMHLDILFGIFPYVETIVVDRNKSISSDGFKLLLNKIQSLKEEGSSLKLKSMSLKECFWNAIDINDWKCLLDIQL